MRPLYRVVAVPYFVKTMNKLGVHFADVCIRLYGVDAVTRWCSKISDTLLTYSRLSLCVILFTILQTVRTVSTKWTFHSLPTNLCTVP